MNSENPYSGLPETRFWKHGVENADPFDLQGLYQKKWAISPTDKIATAGSCFAQHISRYLKKSGYQVIDKEPPHEGLPEDVNRKFGYGLYSARYGNIYTLAQLLLLLREVVGSYTPTDQDLVWVGENGRFYDAFRPAIEPEGFCSLTELRIHRDFHLKKLRELFVEMDVFVFTLGLTETWARTTGDAVYPVAPGVIAGQYNADKFCFKNTNYADNISFFQEIREILHDLRQDRPAPRFLLTVSPVPLTATASGNHVLAATTYSKSVLRAVAGYLADSEPDVDYFPSYEIITNQAMRGCFYEKNLRQVRQAGVEAAMSVFFGQHKQMLDHVETAPESAFWQQQKRDEDLQCEEAGLEDLSP